MQVPNDIVPGRLLSRHGRTRAHRFVLAVALMFLVVGAGLPLLLTTGARFAPEGRPLILGTAGLLLAIGLVLTVAWRAIRPKTTLDLHLHGIVVRHTSPRKETFAPFMAMSDLYLYRTGRSLFGPANALAFRRSPADAWVDVLDDRGDAFRLRGEIIEGQLRERGPLALRSLETGHALTFHSITDADRLAKRVMGGMLSAEARPLQLSSAGLDVGGQRIPIADIAKLDEGGPNGSLRLFDAYGHTLWSVHTLSLFSADLFIVLMRTMIEAHQYGITQKNRPPEIHTQAADVGGAGDATGREDGES
jgi:hypothetical protein